MRVIPSEVEMASQDLTRVLCISSQRANRILGPWKCVNGDVNFTPNSANFNISLSCTAGEQYVNIFTSESGLSEQIWTVISFKGVMVVRPED